MSDLKINNILNTNTPDISAARRPAPPQKPPLPKPEQDTTKAAEASENVKTEEYGPVIATSSDGDTVRVKSENENENEESRIYDAAAATSEKETRQPEIPDVELPPPPKPKPELKPIETAKGDSTEDTTASSQSSYKTLTKSQLEQMYLQGDISQAAYNLEMDARKAAEEEKAKDEQSEDTKEFINDMSDSASRQSEIAQTAANIDTILNGDSSETIPVDVRMQAIQNLDNMFQ